jgi:hypothetical protein
MKPSHWAGRNGSKPKKPGHKSAYKKPPATDSLLEQPIAESHGALPCPICGHPVDPKRLHPHMVRFHNVTIRSKGTWAA